MLHVWLPEIVGGPVFSSKPNYGQSMRESSCKMSTPISSQNWQKYGEIEEHGTIAYSKVTFMWPSPSKRIKTTSRFCSICRFLAACPSRLDEAAHGGLPPNAWKGVLPNSGPLLCGSWGGAIKPMSQFMLQCLQVLMRLDAIQRVYSATRYCSFVRVLGDSTWFISKYLLCGPSHSFQWYTAHRLAQRSKRRFPARRRLLTKKSRRNKKEIRKLYRYGCVWVNPCWSFDHATTSSSQKLYGAITLRLSFQSSSAGEDLRPQRQAQLADPRIIQNPAWYVEARPLQVVVKATFRMLLDVPGLVPWEDRKREPTWANFITWTD